MKNFVIANQESQSRCVVAKVTLTNDVIHNFKALRHKSYQSYLSFVMKTLIFTSLKMAAIFCLFSIR